MPHLQQTKAIIYYIISPLKTDIKYIVLSEEKIVEYKLKAMIQNVQKFSNPLPSVTKE